jgi:hypothetical protein
VQKDGKPPVYVTGKAWGVFGGLQVKLTSNPALHFPAFSGIFRHFPANAGKWVHFTQMGSKLAQTDAKGCKKMENHQYRLQARCGMCLDQ